jgi:hypothetical protein
MPGRPCGWRGSSPIWSPPGAQTWRWCSLGGSTCLCCPRSKKPCSTVATSRREATGHPDGCYGLWAGSVEVLAEQRCAAWPYDNVLTIEADGVPLRWDWIDQIKRVHAEHLDSGKRITGVRMFQGQRHVNGTMAMHLSCWDDHPSLHRCRAGQPWDCFHGQTLLRECGDRSAIVNLYGVQDVSPSVFSILGHEHAWLASSKDESAWRCAQGLLAERRL